jgi:sugar/nucleoside kinase (ribokinase family)
VTKCDCLCVGIVVADFVCAPVPSIPRAGGLVMTDGISLAIGGCASNVAVDLAKLGLSAGVVGCVGQDAPGRFVRDSLAAARVDVAGLREVPHVPTSATMIINVRGEDRRFIHAFGANALFDGSQLDLDDLAQARALYVGGFLLMPAFSGQRVARLFQAARQAGVPTILDVVVPAPGDYRAELAAVLPWTDVFLPNVDEGAQLVGTHDPLQQAESFRALGASTVVITCGSDGALLVDGQRRLRSQTFKVEFVDGTGSGDAFAAGYIAAMLEGASSDRCLETGSALGASCVRSAGATTGVFTRSELDDFLRCNRLRIDAAPNS